MAITAPGWLTVPVVRLGAGAGTSGQGRDGISHPLDGATELRSILLMAALESITKVVIRFGLVWNWKLP